MRWSTTWPEAVPYTRVSLPLTALAARVLHRYVMQVLIVDDSGLIRERLRELLVEIDRCQVSGAAATVAEALNELRRSHPDLVILDAQLPDGEGLVVLKAAKRMTPAPLVAVLTNHYQTPYRQRYLGAGADFFWEKGKDLERLLDAVRGLTAQASTDEHP